jgi:hypothetical protein
MENSESSDSDMDWTNEEDGIAAQSETSMTEEGGRPSQNEPGYHCLQKVLPIITHMKWKYKENYSPHPQNSVDEAMIGYKGKKHNLFTNTPMHAHRSVLHDSVHAHEAYEEGIPDGNNMLGAG